MTITEPFTTVEVTHGDTRVRVPAEPTSHPALFITPQLGATGLFTGGFSLIHAPTGRSVTRDDPGVLRALVEKVHGLDWSFTDPSAIPVETTAGAVEAIRGLAFTDPTSVELPAHPPWRGDDLDGGLKRAALPLMADLLAGFQHSWDRTTGSKGDIRPDIPHPDKPGETTHNPEWHLHIAIQVQMYGVAYLLGALHSVDPEVADSAAASLADAWEAGDSLGEWAYQWAQELAKGEPLTLPGVPGPAVGLLAP